MAGRLHRGQHADDLHLSPRVDEQVPYEHFIRLLSCVQACFKYSMGDRQMPRESLQALMLDTLEYVMGQDNLARWLQREHIQREDP
jgi:hypothetical protein